MDRVHWTNRQRNISQKKKKKKGNIPSAILALRRKGTHTNCPCVLVLSLMQVTTDVCKPNYEIKALLVLQNTTLIVTHESWLALPRDWLSCYHNYRHATVVPQMLYRKTQEDRSFCPRSLQRERDIGMRATNTGCKQKRRRRKRSPHLKAQEMCFS